MGHRRKKRLFYLLIKVWGPSFLIVAFAGRVNTANEEKVEMYRKGRHAIIL